MHLAFTALLIMYYNIAALDALHKELTDPLVAFFQLFISKCFLKRSEMTTFIHMAIEFTNKLL